MPHIHDGGERRGSGSAATPSGDDLIHHALVPTQPLIAYPFGRPRRRRCQAAAENLEMDRLNVADFRGYGKEVRVFLVAQK
jgi:hypothetical protein